MRSEEADLPLPDGLDIKAIGYLTSILSVLFLGATSIIGMGFR